MNYIIYTLTIIRPPPKTQLFPYTTLFRSGATAKDISNVVTDAASGVVDIFNGIDKAVADTWNNFNHTRSSISRSEERFSRNAETDLVCSLLLEKRKMTTGWRHYRYLVYNR